ncbi:MAG: 1,6-anhydro-N-acetylmuramyl-L-alanine amidase AmpD [Burkholderiales bacterium]|jgi:AmpD protein|nr:1,6-anhydro-N-acetylmuramyl-L-alanine amidase AmpD [Burkholderiales bacterium]
MHRPDLILDEQGVLAGARFVPSPNADARPEGETPSLVVVHGISLPPREFGSDAVERLFTNRIDPAAHPYFGQLAGLAVSSHFFVRRSGEIVQFVPCALRAWHAGVSVWRGRERCNDFSVGVELEGADDVAYLESQYLQIARVVDALRHRYPIADVVGHEHIAPGRKSDPGPAFDWLHFRAHLDSRA